MNPGIFGFSYGAPLDPYRRRVRYGQGTNRFNFDVLVLGITDTTTPASKSTGGGTKGVNVTDLVLQVPYAVGRRGQVVTAAGGLSAQIPDGTIVGGNRRGAGAVDLQSDRNNANQVASGVMSVTLGRGNLASAQAAVALGEYNTASGQDAFAAGYLNTASAGQSVAIGQSCQATAAGSMALGFTAIADATGAIAMGTRAYSRGVQNRFCWSGSMRAASGDRHTPPGFPLCATTSNETPTVLTTNAGAAAANNTFVLANNTTCWVRGTIVARNAANNDSIAWTFSGLVSRDATAASTALLGAVTPATVGTADASMTGCSLAVGVNTTNGSLIVTATGIAATTITWNGYLDIVENG